jgi:hypothetical protein
MFKTLSRQYCILSSKVPIGDQYYYCGDERGFWTPTGRETKSYPGEVSSETTESYGGTTEMTQG